MSKSACLPALHEPCLDVTRDYSSPLFAMSDIQDRLKHVYTLLIKSH